MLRIPPPTAIPHVLLVLLLAILALATSGCAVVKPWEREVMAREDMAFVTDQTASARRAHIHSSKEASLPGGGTGGGGCGCN